MALIKKAKRIERITHYIYTCVKTTACKAFNLYRNREMVFI